MLLREIEDQAKYLAQENREAEPTIHKVYWFPNETEIRLVELSPQIPKTTDGRVHPYYFRPSPQNDIPAPSGIAIIRPEEFKQLELPPDWGSWDDAKEL